MQQSWRKTSEIHFGSPATIGMRSGEALCTALSANFEKSNNYRVGQLPALGGSDSRHEEF